jgi:hypothetical protein
MLKHPDGVESLVKTAPTAATGLPDFTVWAVKGPESNMRNRLRFSYPPDEGWSRQSCKRLQDFWVSEWRGVHYD